MKENATMTGSEKQRWEKWAVDLRQSMMSELKPEITKSVDQIADETGTDKTSSVLCSRRFWDSCQAGKSPNGAIKKAGFEIDFDLTEQDDIDTVTLRLNDTWKGIMQRVLDRQ